MIRKVKHGVYEKRTKSSYRVTVTHVGVYMNKPDGSFESGVIYHSFNEPNYVTQVMSQRDFLSCFRYVGKLFTIHSVEERVQQ